MAPRRKTLLLLPAMLFAALVGVAAGAGCTGEVEPSLNPQPLPPQAPPEDGQNGDEPTAPPPEGFGGADDGPEGARGPAAPPPDGGAAYPH